MKRQRRSKLSGNGTSGTRARRSTAEFRRGIGVRREPMAVDPKDREAYERGQEDSKADIISRFIQDQASFLLDSESEREAYNKGRRGEQLDGDKADGS